MIQALLNFCLRERLVVFIASAALIAYGWHATQHVPLDAIPNVGENQVIVLTEWMGRSPRTSRIRSRIHCPWRCRPCRGPRVSAAKACSALALCR